MRIIWVLIITSALLTAGFTLYPEWIHLNEMKFNLAKQRTELERVQKLTHEHEQEIHFLETDRDYLETVARDRLDMMKEGETIFRLSGTQHPRS
jgi:cell division protein FtsB